MMRFLRYNSRHSLYRGDRGLELNPIMSSSHRKDGTRTWRWHEPLWLFRLRQRIFAFAGRQRCGRRAEGWHGQTDEALPDTWDWGPDGCRTCSWCGSIHPDDMLRIARLVPDDDRYGIEGTTKSYKRYIRQPGVRNASEGAIKFYMAHAPEHPSEEDQAAFALAVRLTHERAMARWSVPASGTTR